MFENILVYIKEYPSDQTNATIEKTRSYLNEFDCSIKNIKYLNKEDLENKDLVITVGGDGTLLRASTYLKDIPILGIQGDDQSKGFLMSLVYDQVGELEKILKGDYDTIQRQRAQAKRNNELLDEIALNEVYLGVKKIRDMAVYTIDFKGEREKQKTSGVLVATGTGSTAFYESAGGTPFPYNEEALKFKLVLPNPSDNYKITDGTLENGSIMITSHRYHGGEIAIDSHTTYPFNNGDTVEVNLSNYPLEVIIPKL